ncbi:MAG: hypothetical protein F4X03_11640 [Dehalococcoidia bacterium]|nr:hypothetical protein [Dehalococcoidia bacterium]MYD29539.1 hypothetical protein [Dehalococcoidia bacterium]
MPETNTHTPSCIGKPNHLWDIPAPLDRYLRCLDCTYEYDLLDVTPDARAEIIDDMRFTAARAFFHQPLDATIAALRRSQELGLV